VDYRCSLGDCGEPTTTTNFDLEPGAFLPLNDLVGGTFVRPESGGAVEVSADGAIAATSRLYTPSHPAPTVGMFVPGLEAAEAAPMAILPLLSFSADKTHGSRVNVGVYNGADQPRGVSLRLFDATGQELGRTFRSLDPRTSVQLNDFFGQLGIDSDVPFAYARVEADGFGALFPYAAVIDNGSQDPIFVVGEPIPPP
jgi:hypothetical protein